MARHESTSTPPFAQATPVPLDYRRPRPRPRRTRATDDPPSPLARTSSGLGAFTLLTVIVAISSAVSGVEVPPWLGVAAGVTACTAVLAWAAALPMAVIEFGDAPPRSLRRRQACIALWLWGACVIVVMAVVPVASVSGWIAD